MKSQWWYARASSLRSTRRVVFSLRDRERDGQTSGRELGGRMFNRTRETLSEVKRLTVEKAPSVSLYDRFKFVVIEYGKVALAFHASGMPIGVVSHVYCRSLLQGVVSFVSSRSLFQVLGLFFK